MEREKAITLADIGPHEFKAMRATPELCQVCWHGPGAVVHRGPQEQAAETVDRTMPREVGS